MIITAIYFITLCMALVISFYISLNLFQKNKVLLKAVEEGDKNLYSAVNVVEFAQQMLAKTFATMKQVDKRGGFSSDDEIGFAFKAIYESIEQCKAAIDQLTEIKNKQDIKNGGDVNSVAALRPRRIKEA